MSNRNLLRFGNNPPKPKKRGAKKTKFVLSIATGYKAPRHGMKWERTGEGYVEVAR